ncbi:hypothetical protein OV203_47185 [Nannocystis sp. ILAH1]|uniref:hypothetical protein n=1 Tax=Nannocystis sp. ILAH1 TaxID=2996789 RepID=UPI00226F1C63|nr:hypothetical protein [Nannocystis sp. ILAH1]MCY0994802.1 hypothetical protein [Nannocystis sp. ILAH1]
MAKVSVLNFAKIDSKVKLENVLRENFAELDPALAKMVANHCSFFINGNNAALTGEATTNLSEGNDSPDELGGLIPQNQANNPTSKESEKEKRFTHEVRDRPDYGFPKP